ncbi:MAG: AAA family ATPase [Myxococcales bacterium]|nr:AAA family ATPase [Myxococcales bacterium]MCB9522135.1 AAA family ATPase [Myxococcales bacterium]
MDTLVSFIEGHLDELVVDLLATLREADDAFREVDPQALATGLHACLWHYSLYAHGRDYRHVEQSRQALVRVWGEERMLLSIPIRIFFGVEDLVAIRARERYRDADDLIDDLRALRAATRQVLCHFADAGQGRFMGVGAAPQPVNTLPLHDHGAVSAAAAFEPRATVAEPVGHATAVTQPGLGHRVGAVRFVGRRSELETLWVRIEAIADGAQTSHQVVGLKGAAGFGKTALVDRLLDRFERRRGVPHVLRAHAPRLFNVPRWPVIAWVRQALGVPIGVEDVRARVAEAIQGLLPWIPPASEGLDLGVEYLARLLGDESVAEAKEARQIGAGTRQALLTLMETLARRAMEESHGPLCLVIEDADELDGPSWSLLVSLLQQLPVTAPVAVLLTYDVRFTAPPAVTRVGGFFEVVVQPFELPEFEGMLDALLEPNDLGEETRLRLSLGAHGSPLLLHESLRQLIEDGIIGQRDGRWVELAPLPDGVVGDLGLIVIRRTQHLSPQTRLVLEALTVIEDTIGGSALEEMVARHGLSAGEVVDALGVLEQTGLIKVVPGQPLSAARIRHTLVRDELYRQLSAERRKALHEDAGELFARLAGAAAFPSVAGGHLALAGWPHRALDALIRAANRCLEGHVLDGALELVSQAMGLVDGLPPGDAGKFRYAVLAVRAKVYGRLGRFDLERDDVIELEALARAVASPKARGNWSLRLAALALAGGERAEAEQHLSDAGAASRGTAEWARRQLTRALACWQNGQQSEARVFLREVAEIEAELPAALRARVAHARGRLAASGPRIDDALAILFEAWRSFRTLGDPLGEGLVVRDLADVFQTLGRLLDAVRLLRRAESLLRAAEAPHAQGDVLLRLGNLHTRIGDFDEAEAYYARVLRLLDKNRHREAYAAAVVGQGRILVNRGRFDDAMTLLAQCLKDLGRRSMKTPVYVDALVALATNFVLFARGEKLVVGGLRYAGEAADRATEIGHFGGLIDALAIQVRGLVALDRAPEAEARLAELDAALASALEVDRRLARQRVVVELARHAVLKKLGRDDQAHVAAQAAKAELRAQAATLEGSGFERGFLANVHTHREVMEAAG